MNYMDNIQKQKKTKTEKNHRKGKCKRAGIKGKISEKRKEN